MIRNWYILALTVTEAAQIVGTLLVLSLDVTPALTATHPRAPVARRDKQS